jgi:hypothetical protein
MSATTLERTVFRIAVAVVDVHVLDDMLVQPPSGTPATDHLRQRRRPGRPARAPRVGVSAPLGLGVPAYAIGRRP